MLDEHTLNQLRTMRLDGMVAALQDGAAHIAASELSFDQRLVLLVQREVDWRDSKRLERLLKAARLKVSSACLEDVDWRASRGLSREVISSLAGGDWLRHGYNVLLTGVAGCGKTWLACALGKQAAHLGFSVLYARAPRLLEELHVAHGDTRARNGTESGRGRVPRCRPGMAAPSELAAGYHRAMFIQFGQIALGGGVLMS